MADKDGPHHRVLILGPTGIDKKHACEMVAEYANRYFKHDIRNYDFEKDFISPLVPDFQTFLNDRITVAYGIWERAWEEFKKELNGDIFLLSLHATYVSGLFGARTAIGIRQICEDFKPSLIITLIDDVFNMWGRTEKRADGRARLRPTMEQILMARRTEVLLGDLIMTTRQPDQVKHIICSVNHPVEVIVNPIIFDADVTYLSFPISEPLQMIEKSGDFALKEYIDKAHRLALKEMKSDRTRCFISPLSIDETPFLHARNDENKIVYEVDGKKVLKFRFDAEGSRWSLADLWGADTELIAKPFELKEIEFDWEQVANAEGVVWTDIGWRDRRLVLQSRNLAVICPVPPTRDEITGGVKDEIETAIPNGIYCYIWQEKKWDPQDIVRRTYKRDTSMGLGAVRQMTEIVDSLEDLIQMKP